jgi:transcriptional regulator with PAS, ATPase and Fis domain
MITDGTLRQDLYFRLSTVKIKVPSLRERLDGLALLSEVFLLRLARKYKKPMRGISPASLSMLMHYNWPGNVRELEGVIEHAVLFSQTDYLQPEDLPDHLRTSHKRNFLCVIPPYLRMTSSERRLRKRWSAPAATSKRPRRYSTTIDQHFTENCGVSVCGNR